MSLPPGFLDELQSRLSLTQVVGRKVMWDNRKSNQGKGDMWAPCPFHHEKTASFHVDDRKGFYYCFGCHAKGDAISFVKETENVSFIEAVEILAREAGMQVPKRDPEAQKKADKRSTLSDITELALQYYRLQLNTGAAEAARAYLATRGLDQACLDRFEIGFAPDNRQGLFQHLTQKNIPPEQIIEAGLCAKPDDGGAPYDRFRGRIMYPIRDARGRAIAFGGRAMDPNARAKYMNSPETPLFDKGRNLYNLGPARQAVGKGAPFIVAEGYMDVIALVEAGFQGAVAPLGTAITQGQLELMWRVTPEPLIALDGDTAGLRAAYRLIDLALPLLQAGRSLRFILMPEGQDPDDLIRAKGAGAVQTLIDQAMPLVDLLWRRETEGKVFDSPERKAALDKVLRDKLTQIQDVGLRRHYGDAIKELRYTLFRPNRGGGTWKGRPQRAHAMMSTKSSMLAAAPEDMSIKLHQGVILAGLIKVPELIPVFLDDLADMRCADMDFDRLRQSVMGAVGCDTLEDDLRETYGHDVLEALFGLPHVAISPAMRSVADVERVEMTIAEGFAKITALRGVEQEVSEAIEHGSDAFEDDRILWRLGQAAMQKEHAQRPQQADKAIYEVGENGVRIDKKERDALDALLGAIKFQKK